MQARLLLENGSLFTGKSFGSGRESIGEIVFNTGVTGYQEVISDPSFCGQIVTMTYPLIGNYGINRDDFESIRPEIFGLVVREYEEVPSNWRAQYTLDQLLKEHHIPGIYDIDTRMLTRTIRDHGAMKAILTTGEESIADLLEKLQATELPYDLVDRVSTKNIYRSPGSEERVVLVDFGTKSGVLRALTKRGCDVVVVPHTTTAEEIRRLSPDGILLSNGPGNPKDVPHAIQMVQELLGEVPIFGICLGHQLFALACGADTEKMTFGHRGSNLPVKDLVTGRCYITSQNHGYTVNPSSVGKTPLVVTHINNNDQTIEGLKHKHVPAFSVQYHPEAGPGPADSSHLFEHFIDLMRSFKQTNSELPVQARFVAESKGELQHAQK